MHAAQAPNGISFIELALISVLLTGCATMNDAADSQLESKSESGEQVADVAKTKKICKRETPTGSHRTHMEISGVGTNHLRLPSNERRATAPTRGPVLS